MTIDLFPASKFVICGSICITINGRHSMPVPIFVIALLKWLHVSNFGRCSLSLFSSYEKSMPQGCGADSGRHNGPVTGNGEQASLCIVSIIF
jgi:hypothetical protein